MMLRSKLWQQQPLRHKFAILITTIVLITTTVSTLVTIQREQAVFKGELEQQSQLLLTTLSASTADALYQLDADYLGDLMHNLSRSNFMTYGRIYDADGRVIADAITPDARFSATPDPLGQQLLTTTDTLFIWEDTQLLAGQAVIAGNQPIGAIAVGLPTTPLTIKIADARNQGIFLGIIILAIGIILAFTTSRTIVHPIQRLTYAAAKLRAGDFSQRVPPTKSQDEIGELSHGFNLMAAKLEELVSQMSAEIEDRKQAQKQAQEAQTTAETANQAKSIFLANMSHELRTPLSAILGFAQVLGQSNNLAPEDKEKIRIIGQSGQHLLTVINQILDMSKIEAGRMTLEERPFSLPALIRDIEAMFTLRAQNQDINFAVTLPANLPTMVEGDNVKIRQILINLLGNAFKFSAQGHVQLQIFYIPPHDQQAQIHITIKDTGPGIQPHELDLIFEPFMQAESSRDGGQGTGLGLPLSRQFAQLMGGDITARNVGDQPGHGAIFECYLPLTLINATTIPTPSSPDRIVGLAPDQPNYRILIVDDSWINRQLLVQLLAPLGFALQEANNGREAIDVWQKWRPHLIWMDMYMPEMDGDEATRQIKAQPDSEETIIIAITANAFLEDQERILDAGCVDIIHKPFQVEDIFQALATHLGLVYQYEHLPSTTDTTPQFDWEAIPTDYLRQLQTAVSLGAMEDIDTIIAKIKKHESDLANALHKLAYNFEYEQILSLLNNHIP
ncbi:MAG TPA: ATP-binding protein [Anaerolineae bacterium]|nr:ATP-binding protein [Anaerolineae bacterium]